MTHFHKSTQFAMLLILALAAGCNVLPQRRFKPTLHNPRMQLREVAIVPFLNRSGNPTVDGTEVAQLYANQTQRISGFNVTPVETVKQAMIDTKLMKFESVDDIRALGEYLNVDVVVLGTVNQYSSYQPPTITLETEWYATNPYFHPIVKGHGLPWGTPAEREIPDAILLEVEQDLARAQLATQTPDPKAPPTQPAAPQPLQLQNDWQPGMFPQTQPYGQPGAQPYGLPSTVPNMTQPDASYFPPSLSSVQNGDFNGGNIGGNVDGNRFTTAYYPQTNQFDTGYSNYYAEEEPVDAETQLYLQRQQQTMDEISLRAQGIFSRPKKTPKPDASRQYEPYETPPTLPSRRITDVSGQSNLSPVESQPDAGQALPIVMGYIPGPPDYAAVMPGAPVGQGMIAGEPDAFPGLPANWPDPRGLIPDGPQAGPPTELTVNNEPVMRHVATYNGNDVDFTRRLADYDSLFLDDRRIGGWQGILRRRTDFISACCCMHIWEMLSTRGGAGKAERVCTEEKFWMNP